MAKTKEERRKENNINLIVFVDSERKWQTYKHQRKKRSKKMKFWINNSMGWIQ